MTYRVCIPTAGTGSRLGELTRYLNKSLVSIANRPTLSHLIEQFPADAEFVIALGHQGHLVREFLELAYPQRKFYFSQVTPFEGPGSGLGLSLLACKDHLQQPFVFISCDTLVEEPIPAPQRNWAAYAEQSDPNHTYRSLRVADGSVLAIEEKGQARNQSHQPYIGLAGIHDYRLFWDAMEQGGATAIEVGEAHGLRALIPAALAAHAFTWHDTGNPHALTMTRERYRQPDEPNILEKANEAIWLVGDQVIKFSSDEKFIANRVKRVSQLQGFVPQVTGATTHMYRYPKAAGGVMSEVVTPPLFERLLEHCTRFWRSQALAQNDRDAFRHTCLRFYRDKTLERVRLFQENFFRPDANESINGVNMLTLAHLLEQLDWDWLADGLPSRYHGDFHFENILWNEADQAFIFLDWRQDFGGNLTIGDVYYDLAKLLHGLIVSHEMIVRDLYRVVWESSAIRFDVHRSHILVECEKYLMSWLDQHGYDRRKVRVLTALVYLNIAALHHHPYSLLLYALGKSMLAHEMRLENND